MIMKSLVINCVIVVINLAVVRHTIGEQRLVDFDFYYHHYYKNFIQSTKVVSVNEKYEVTLAEQSINKYDGRIIKMSQVEKTVQVNCKVFISFKRKEEGLYTCQDDDGKYYVILSKSVSVIETVSYIDWRVTCEKFLVEIIEGEELQIQCQVQPTPTSKFNRGKITIGWIQGSDKIIHSYKLKNDTISFSQNFTGFHSGEGLFFYCHKPEAKFLVHHCYALVVKVLPRLEVNVNDAGQCCFECQATGGTDEKVYNETLHELILASEDNQKSKICLTNLTANNFTVDFLVSNNYLKSPDVIEFPVEGDILADTTTQIPTQPKKQVGNTKDFMATDTKTTPQTVIPQDVKDRSIIIMIILGSTTVCLFAVVLVLCLQKQVDKSQYVLDIRHIIRRNQEETEQTYPNGADKQPTRQQQNMADTLDETETNTDDEGMYFDIKDGEKEATSRSQHRQAVEYSRKMHKNQKTMKSIMKLKNLRSFNNQMVGKLSRQSIGYIDDV